MENAILQSTKEISYAQGKHIGKGPSLEKLKERIATRPTQVVRMVNEATEGTPLYKAPTPLRQQTRKLHATKENPQR